MLADIKAINDAEFDGDRRLKVVEQEIYGSMESMYVGGNVASYLGADYWEFREESEGVWLGVEYSGGGGEVEPIVIYHPDLTDADIKEVVSGTTGHNVQMVNYGTEESIQYTGLVERVTTNER